MSARDAILATLRAAPRQDVPAPEAAVDLAPAAVDTEVQHDGQQEGRRVERFTAALRASRAEVHVAEAADWPAEVCALLAARGLRTVLVAGRTAVGRRLRAAAGDRLDCIAYGDGGAADGGAAPAARAAWRERLFDGIDAAVTRARCAIADTGSVVLWPDADEPRLMSLVPPVHVVLVDPRTLHPDLGTAIAQERWDRGLPSNVLLVSGPSKTADIQQTLAYGAHGPRELIVVLCRIDREAS